MPNSLTSSQCYSTWNLFLGGLNLSQAQNEATSKIGTIADEGTSGYWYKSNSMSGSLCAISCLKYGFIYAAIEPK